YQNTKQENSSSLSLFYHFVHLDESVEIIGGHEVTPHSRPYMALIQHVRNKKSICGGTLIKLNWVLTAAHCIQSRNLFHVILGAHSISEKEKEKQIFKVKNIFPHPCFDNDTHENDIMLLQLDHPARPSKSVKDLKLPKSWHDVSNETKCRVAGWGITKNHNRKPSDKLQEVNVTIIDRKTCNSENFYNFNPVITMNMLCAGDKNGGRDAC
uniref:Peptidase S1 domain-containing protein n=1 Tax=Latimeria chalumnae TaxID=7897 RepID=H2ZSN4_LATCH